MTENILSVSELSRVKGLTFYPRIYPLIDAACGEADRSKFIADALRKSPQKGISEKNSNERTQIAANTLRSMVRYVPKKDVDLLMQQILDDDKEIKSLKTFLVLEPWYVTFSARCEGTAAITVDGISGTQLKEAERFLRVMEVLADPVVKALLEADRKKRQTR